MSIDPRRHGESVEAFKERANAYGRDVLARSAPTAGDEAIIEYMRSAGTLVRSLERQGLVPLPEDFADDVEQVADAES